jgi:Ca2+-transporting ATPase
MNWYQLTVKETFEKLRASESGLSDSEIKERLLQFGPNKFIEEERISKLKILLHQFTSPLISILLIAGVVTIFLKEYIDSGVIFAVVILNARFCGKEKRKKSTAKSLCPEISSCWHQE